MKPRYTRFGPAYDYRGAHVTLDYGDRKLLGTIVGVRYDDVFGVWRAQVRHFNGEEWPLEPVLSSLEIIERR